MNQSSKKSNKRKIIWAIALMVAAAAFVAIFVEIM